MATQNKQLDEIASKLARIHKSICCLTDALAPTNTPEYDVEKVCLSDDGGITTVVGFAAFDKLAPATPPILYLNGVDVTATHQIVLCPSGQYDYEEEKVCVNGETWTKWWVWDVTTTPPVLVTVLWLDANDAPIAAPDPLLIGNVNCVPTCLPTISDAYANDLSTLLPGTSFVITKPDCCAVQIQTSVGTFSLRNKETYYATTDFNCPITINSVTITSGTCSLTEIHIISNFKG